MMREKYTESYLYHHGIKGQKWGDRNGPPYPLGASDHSSRERKAGWRKSLKKSSSKKSENSNERSGLTDKQKKAIKIGIAVAGTALVAYGGYRLAKSGKLDGLADKINLGKSKTNDLLAGDTGISGTTSSAKTPTLFKTTGKDITSGRVSAQDFSHSDMKTVAGFKVLNEPESIENLTKSIKDGANGTVVNPNRGDPAYSNDCTRCAVNTFLRSNGLDVRAKSSGGEPDNLLGVVEDLFKDPSRPDGNVRVLDGKAVKFGTSKEAASEMIVNKFGKNAKGVVSVELTNGSGHAFNFFAKDGVVSFVDGQDSQSPVNTSIDAFWQRIKTDGSLQMADLSNAELVVDKLNKYAE